MPEIFGFTFRRNIDKVYIEESFTDLLFGRKSDPSMYTRVAPKIENSVIAGK